MTRPTDPVDLYLLRVLCTLVAERSVSRAAIKLNQSQPAVSTSLKRLREIFNDPLLVREGAAMVPTEPGGGSTALPPAPSPTAGGAGGGVNAIGPTARKEPLPPVGGGPGVPPLTPEEIDERIRAAL